MGAAGETGLGRHLAVLRRVASPEIPDNTLREIERVGEAIGRNPLVRRLREELGPGL